MQTGSSFFSDFVCEKGGGDNYTVQSFCVVEKHCQFLSGRPNKKLESTFEREPPDGDAVLLPNKLA